MAQMKGVGGREWGKSFARSSFWQAAANARGEDGGKMDGIRHSGENVRELGAVFPAQK